MTRRDLADRQRELLSGYVLYDLRPEEAAMVEQWMATDPAIAQEIASLQNALEAAYAPEAMVPPAALRASVLAAYQAQLSSTSSQGTRDLSRQSPLASRNRGLRVLGVIAALLIAGLGLSNYHLWRSLQQATLPPPTLDQPRQNQPRQTLTLVLKPPEDNPSQGSALVTLDLARFQASLTPQLPPPPDGQVYVLWTVLAADAPFTTDDKNAILTHIFSTGSETGSEESVILPPVYQDIRWISAIAITLEAADAPQRHVASPVVIAQL